MAIPLIILRNVKDLVRLPDSVTEFDALIESLYTRVLDELVRATDWLAIREDLETVAEQRVYQTSRAMARLIAVLYAGVHLPKVSANSMDRLRPDWQAGVNAADVPGTPEEWWFNALPEFYSPESFILHPTPATGGEILITYQIAGTDTPVMWLHPVLIYRTVSQFLSGSHKQRDLQGSQFFGQLAAIWMQVLTARIPAS